jgi:ABC-type nitrate/sulfonate/bicarbonate transport system substrate-binding protein
LQGSATDINQHLWEEIAVEYRRFARAPHAETNHIARRSVLLGIGAALAAPAVLRAENTLISVKIPISSASFANAGAKAAVTLGLFRKRGLDVSFVNTDSANVATTTLVSGAVDVALSGAGELVAALSKGIPIAILTHAYWGFGATLVLSSAAANKTGVSPKDDVAKRMKALEGLVIASATPTSAYTQAFKGLGESHGVKLRFTFMGQPQMLAGLEAGVIDGFIASAPYWGIPVEAGRAVEWVSGPKKEVPPQFAPGSSNSFQVMRANAAAKRELMRNVLGAYQDLTDMIKADPEKVKAAVAPQYPNLTAQALTLLFDSESPNWLFRELTVGDIRHEVDFMRTSAGVTVADTSDKALQAVIFKP